MRQFDICRLAGGTLVMILQSDLLEASTTRVVAPLLPESRVPPIRHLTPLIAVEGAAFRLMPQLMATLTLAELGESVGSAAGQRDEVTRALDTLLAGV